jgi:hypothetical protein
MTETVLDEIQLDEIYPPESFSADYDGDRFEYVEEVKVPDEVDTIDFVSQTHHELRRLWDEYDLSADFGWSLIDGEDAVRFRTTYDKGQDLNAVACIVAELCMVEEGVVA